jgi:aminopeptidase YwaD
MPINPRRDNVLPFFLLLLFLCAVHFAVNAVAQEIPATAAKSKAATRGSRAQAVPAVCAVCIRGHMEFLASDALQGRGSGTHDELLAATYIGSELRSYGIEPAGDDGGYIQKATLIKRKIGAPPEISFVADGGVKGQITTWTHGKEMVVRRLSQVEFSGPLQKINVDGDDAAVGLNVKPGAVVFLTGKDEKKVRDQIFATILRGAVAVLVPVSAAGRKRWEADGKEFPEIAPAVEGSSQGAMGNINILAVDDGAQDALHKLAEGTVMHFAGHATDPEKSYTWNAVGILRGGDPAQKKNAILITAHLDHLGIGAPVNGDTIYNGADDDASGTTAVLELARVLGQGPKPRRTVIFALFGSEESGGLGSTYFREHPPLPLADIAANLEFEMIGRADPKVADDTLWLSGWERSNLGPQLAAHGAKLVGDPHPEQNFFRRSDNYVLAQQGVVAQTASSYGLHSDYHQPSDDLAHIDFQHMTTAIGSLIRPMEWLVNTDFRPQWNPGGKPASGTP